MLVSPGEALHSSASNLFVFVFGPNGRLAVTQFHEAIVEKNLKFQEPSK